MIIEYTAISNNVVGSKHKARVNSSKPATLRPYSEDLQWRAIWMKEILGYQVHEVTVK